MAKNKAKALGKVAETAKESARLRTLRIDGSQNGATLRTRIVRDKTKYTRTLKHKKSLADAGDFPFLRMFFLCSFDVCFNFVLLGGNP
jgi:hypothetical protein